MKKLLVTLVASLGVFSVATQGAAIEGFGTGGFNIEKWSDSTEGDTIGWAFSVNTNITATDLGYWIDPDGTVDGSHEVGIWDANENLLRSVTVDSLSTDEDNGWMYEPINPLALSAGTTYVIGAVEFPDDDDAYKTGVSSVNDAPEITWLNSRDPTGLVEGLGLAFPAYTATSIGRFGPNFKYVPEPAALAFLLLGGVSLLRRRNG